MRIMIVDDSKTFREATRILLKTNPSYEVVAEADNGKSAIDLYKKFKPEIILMDIEMPVLNGFEATKQLINENSDIKILAISSHLDKLYQKKAMDTGFKGFVYKNNMTEQLFQAIESVSKNRTYIPHELISDF